VETELRRLFYDNKKSIYILPKRGLVSSYIFKEWVLNTFKTYEKEIGNKYLLILNKAPSYCSFDSINFLKVNNAIFITSGMTPICQPLDLIINKFFKSYYKIII